MSAMVALLSYAKPNGGLASVGAVPYAQSVSSDACTRNSVVGRKSVHRTKIGGHCSSAGCKQLKSCSGVAILRDFSPCNPKHSIQGIHGAFHTQDLESTGINHEALCGFHGDCNAKRKEHLTNVVCEVKVSRLVKFMFQRQPSVRQNPRMAGNHFMCFGPVSSRKCAGRVR